MPLYEYECNQCGNREEVVRNVGDPLYVCPMCLVTMEKLVSLPVDYTTGTSRSARQRWARDWTPNSPKFSTGSLHGERY